MRLQISTSCSRVSRGTLPIWFMYIRTGSSRISRRASSSSSAWLRRLGRLALGAFGLGLVHDDFHVQTPQLGQQRVQVFGAEIVRQNVIDVVVSDVAVLLREMQQRLDRLGQIHGRLNGRRSSGVYMAVLRRFRRRFYRGNNCARCMRLGFLRLRGAPARAGNDKTPSHRRRVHPGASSAATSMFARPCAPRRSFSLQHKL